MRWRIHDLLAERGQTAYWLAKQTGLTIPAVYRLSRPGAKLGRVEGRTLDLLCTALGVQPGELLVHEPGNKPR